MALKSAKTHSLRAAFIKRWYGALAILLCGCALSAAAVAAPSDTAVDSTPAWRLQGLFSGLQDGDLEVRSYIVRELALRGGLPKKDRVQGEVERTVQQLLISNVPFQVRKGLDVTAVSIYLTERNEDLVRKQLRSKDEDMVALAARSLSNAELIRPEDGKLLEKFIDAVSKENQRAVLTALKSGGLLTPAHGRLLAAKFLDPNFLENASLEKLLSDFQLFEEGDQKALEERIKGLDPKTDNFKVQDLAAALIDAHDLIDPVYIKLETLMDSGDLAPAQAAATLLAAAGSEFRARAVAHLSSELKLANKNLGQVCYLIGFLKAGGEVDLSEVERLLLPDTSDEIKTVALRLLLTMGAIQPRHQTAALAVVNAPSSRSGFMAANALSKMGAPETTYLPRMKRLLTESDPDMALSALVFLQEHNALTSEQIPDLVDHIVRGRPTDVGLYANNLCTFAKLPEPAEGALRKNIATADTAFAFVGSASALHKCNAATAADANIIAQRLDASGNSDDREVLLALGVLGPTAKSVAATIADGLVLPHGTEHLRQMVAQIASSDLDQERLQALREIGPLPPDALVHIVAPAYLIGSARGELWAVAYELSGGRPENLSPLVTLRANESKGDSDRHPVSLTPPLLSSVWSLTRLNDTGVREQIARLASSLVRADSATFSDKDIHEWQRRLREAQFADEAEAFANEEQRRQRVGWITNVVEDSGIVLALHLTFWGLLIFLYPKSPQVQATFFWNSRVREWVGLGYVTALLTWVPALRELLLKPLKHEMIADAFVEDSELQHYFPKRSLQPKALSQAIPADSVMGSPRGHILIVGDAGIGKSMLLRRAAQQSTRPIVFLQAGACSAGVEEAIHAKMDALPVDIAFLRQLLYVGAIDVLIDNLHEAKPDTRAQIHHFLLRNEKVNVVLTSQPLPDWKSSSRTRVFDLLPLRREDLEEFLTSRIDAEPSLAPEARDSADARVREFIKGLREDENAPYGSTAYIAILTNPFDASVAAQLILVNQSPQVFALVGQQVTLALAKFAERHAGQEFPLEAFAESVYRARLDRTERELGAQYLEDIEIFFEFRICLRINRASDGLLMGWVFRHRRFQDYFVAKAMLKVPQRLYQHVDDTRFLGAYEILIPTLAPEVAANLKDRFVTHAADTSDVNALRRILKRLPPPAGQGTGEAPIGT